MERITSVFLLILFGISSESLQSVGGHAYDRHRQERSATPTSTDANNTITALLANATTVWCQNQKAPGSDSMHGLVPQPGLVQGANASSQSAGGAPGSTPLAFYNTGRFPTPIPAILPSVRRIALNNSQMHDVFQHKGGNYLHDYMATTKQEAEKNFPNLLLMTAPVKAATSNATITVYDNYIAMKTIMDDLKQLQVYVSSTPKPVSTPKSKSASTSKPGTNRSAQPSNQNTSTTKATLSYKSSQASSPNNIPSSSYNYNINIAASVTNGAQSSSLPSKYDTITSAKPGIEQKTPKTNGYNHSWISKYQTRQADSGSSKSPTSNIENNKTTIKPASTFNNKFTTSSINSRQTTSSPTTKQTTQQTTQQTTMDPEVSKSLSGLDRYIHGLWGSNQSGFLDTVWREAQTTIHPETLLGLEPGSRRKKRQADGSVSMEQYCQLKGSQTADGYLHMCSTCAVITKLPEDYFPRYINEAVCKTGDSDCFVMQGIAHGTCRQRTITLNIMRKRTNKCLLMVHNGENIMIDDWELYPKTVRVSCECLFNKRSVFAPYIKGSGAHG